MGHDCQTVRGAVPRGVQRVSGAPCQRADGGGGADSGPRWRTERVQLDQSRGAVKAHEAVVVEDQGPELGGVADAVKAHELVMAGVDHWPNMTVSGKSGKREREDSTTRRAA